MRISKKEGHNIMVEAQEYLELNKSKPIYVIYNELKAKKKKSKAEIMILAYLTMNKRKLGIK